MILLYLNEGRPIEPNDSICQMGGLPPSGLSIYAQDEYLCIQHIGSASYVAMTIDVAEILADICMAMISTQVPGPHVVRFDGIVQICDQSSHEPVDTFVMSKDSSHVALKCGPIDAKLDAMEAKLFQLLIRHVIDTSFDDTQIDMPMPQARPTEVCSITTIGLCESKPSGSPAKLSP